MEYSLIEQLQSELDKLYAQLADTRMNDEKTQQKILQEIQSRNLKLSRLMPCE